MSLVEMFSQDIVSVGAFAWWDADRRQRAESLWGKRVTPLLKKTTSEQGTWNTVGADNVAQLKEEVSRG